MTFSPTSKRSSSAGVAYVLHRATLRCTVLAAAGLLPTGAAHAQANSTPKDMSPVSEQWTTYNGDDSGRRYSALAQINASNVTSLALAWAYPTHGLAIKGTPLVVDGVMYFTVPDKTWAVDAETGVKLWEFDRPSQGNKINNRGVAYLKGKVFFGTPDAHMIALDAKSGKLVWDIDVADSKAFGYYIATAPLVVKDKIVFGTSGDVADVPHFMEAVDPETGRLLWRLNTIPKPGEPGFDTWPDANAAAHGGGPIWLTGTYDPVLNLMYWGTGNPHPVLAGNVRQGANLYTCSILAIDPDTGRIKWYYQPSPHDTHDWDAVETPILFDATVGGKPRKLLAHASRNGYYFLLDRTTGEHLVTSQFTPTDWASGLDAKGQPIGSADKEAQPGGVLVHGVVNGATNWWAPSYSPQTGLFYVNAQQGWSFWYSALDKEGKPEDHQGGSAVSLHESSLLVAIEALTGKIAWKRESGDGRVTAGILTTAGHLLFTGDAGGNLVALDPSSGRSLWHTRTGVGLTDGPITYLLHGRQYISMATGDTMYTFALPR